MVEMILLLLLPALLLLYYMRVACHRYLLLLLMFPLLLLVPDKITMWVTDELTVRTQDNKLLVYKQQVHNIPTAPAAVRWLLGLMSSWLLTYLMNW